MRKYHVFKIYPRLEIIDHKEVEVDDWQSVDIVAPPTGSYVYDVQKACWWGSRYVIPNNKLFASTPITVQIVRLDPETVPAGIRTHMLLLM